MSQCKKFAPNIFHKTKCSNCFRQKEEHTAEALECNRASRSIARSGYLFVAPDWDFSVPLNRTKRWQRRWFVLYDDGELNYSVDEHPDTIPQGSVDMSKILEVTGAEQITGHPHSLALTGPDRVTFVKAASREDARWWAELLAVFPRRHKRNATFPGGRASPSLPQLGRSASPQPPRPRHLSCTGPSPRTNFTTPPLKEERESPPKEEGECEVDGGGGDGGGGKWETVVPEIGRSLPIETSMRTDYNVLTSGSPPTRDKLRCEDKARARRDWRNERLRDIATALTDRSPESSLALPAEGLLHLKKGWLWVKDINNEWLRRWIVLCGPTLTVFRDQDESIPPEFIIEMASVISYSEISTESKYGFQIQSSSSNLTLSAVTAGIRSNWLQAIKKAAPHVEIPSTPATPRSVFLSSDEEYRTASEGGRRGSEDWGELPPSPPLARTSLARVKEKARARPRLPRCQSRQSTLDSVSTDELDTSSRDSNDSVDLKNTINKQKAEIDDLQKQLAKAVSEIQILEEEINRLKKLQSESLLRERNAQDMLCLLEESEKKNTQLETKFLREQKRLQKQLTEMETFVKNTEDKCVLLTKELQNKQLLLLNLKEELRNANETITKDNEKINNLQKQLTTTQNYGSLTNLTNIDLDLDLETLTHKELIEYCLDLKSRFEKAIIEIRAVKRELKESYVKCDDLELKNFGLWKRMEGQVKETEAEKALLVARIDHLTSKLTAVEKQVRSKARQEAKDKRRSLSLKGRESFSINKELEDKVTELEAKILSIEHNRPTSKRRHKRERSSERNSPIDDRSLRRLRRKSLDSATASESIKLLMRLSSLEHKVSSFAASNESLNEQQDSGLLLAREKLNDCLSQINRFKSGRSKRSPSPSSERLNLIEHNLSDVCDVLNNHVCGVGSREAEVVLSSANGVVKQLQELLMEKLINLSERRRDLKENNQLDMKTKLELLAEKIAFENILIIKIQEALYTPSTDEGVCGRLLTKEAKETVFLIEALRDKLIGNGEKQTPVCKTGAEYLSGILASILSNTTQELSLRKHYKTKPAPSLQFLAEEQRNINALYETYKQSRLPQLAETLANETFNLLSDKSCRLQYLNEETVSDFRKSAQESVNRELIETEINHVMLRAAQFYESNYSNVDHKFFFTFFASERAALELWTDSVENHLYKEINVCIGELTEHYVNALSKLQRQNWRRRLEWERGHKTATKLLNEFADIVAHKSLIDARLSVLNGQVNRLDLTTVQKQLNLNGLIEKENHKDFLQEQSSVQINQSLEAEFKCMLDRYSMECLLVVEERPEVQEVLESFGELCCEVRELKNCVLNADGDRNDIVAIESLEDVCRKSICLIKDIEEIRRVLQEMNVSSLEIEEEKRPVFYGTEYLNQMENLRSAYRKALAACEDRHKQSDLEKLQHLCERVLIAMEQWHRRTVQDLRETHSRELQLLRQDKEQALAEETQATLAALDAMRKAHEAEVQREVARFKQDFVRQQRDELMELSERLSVKCLEAAALEEQLSSATRQLAHAQQHILQLERNPQLSTVQN